MNVHQLPTQANQDLGQRSWFRANQLYFDASKTKYVLIEEQQSHEQKMLDLTLTDEELERVQSTMFLGLCIDEHLLWKRAPSELYAMNAAKYT